MTITDYLFLLSLFGLCGVLAAWWLYASGRREATQWEKFRQEQKAVAATRIAGLEEDLQEWLATLELPQLAEKTKQQEAARRLSTVIVGRIGLGQRVRGSPISHSPDLQSLPQS